MTQLLTMKKKIPPGNNCLVSSQMAKYQWLEPIKGKLEGDECLKGGGDGEGKRKRDSVVAKKVRRLLGSSC